MKNSSKSGVDVVAVPQALHGHVNPMLSFCKTMIARRRDLHVTLVVTKQWLPSTSQMVEAGGGYDGRLRLFKGVESSDTEKEACERFLDSVFFKSTRNKPDVIVADSFLDWSVGVGEKWNIPIAAFWPAAAALFMVSLHHQKLLATNYFPIDHLSDEKQIDWIPGIGSIRLADLPGEFQTKDEYIFENIIIPAVSTTTKAKFIIFRTMKDLEEDVLKALKTTISIPQFVVGPTIPYSFTISNPNETTITKEYYMKWLDTQQEKSVLYVSLGTFLSVSDAQIDELAIGVRESGIPFLWVARDQRASRMSELLGDKGIVVSWCEQMRVLSHSSVGGFLTHCGWNSTLEVAFSGIPALAFPLGIDQTLNCKLLVDDWGIGWRVKDNFRDMVTKDRISELLKKFMDLEGIERKKLDNKCKKLKEILLLGVGQDGSTSDLDDFFFHLTN